MTAREARRIQWIRVVGQYRRSGLGKAEFARQNGLNRKHLENWDFRLGSGAPKVAAVGGPSAKAPLRLIPVAVQPPAEATFESASKVVVDVRTLQITVPANADVRLVAQLVTALRATTC